jgi:hypothetical protein
MLRFAFMRRIFECIRHIHWRLTRRPRRFSSRYSSIR